MTWTKPYCGVTHVKQPAPGIRQITVCDYGSFADADLFGMHGFTPLMERTFRGESRVEDAKAWLESQVALIGR